MESTFIIKATDLQMRRLWDNYQIKWAVFLGNKDKFPKMNYSSPVVHSWRVMVRHPEDVVFKGRCYSYKGFLKRAERI